MGSTDVYRSNLADVRAAVEASCRRVGRDPSGVCIVGVTKTVEASEVIPLLNAGIQHFGENRWQQARPKFDVPASHQAVWHFIGHLQINKVKYVVPRFTWIHSVDSIELGQAIAFQADKLGNMVNCLIQVNVSGETSKSGVSVEDTERLYTQMRGLTGVRVRGLMTMAPAVSSVEETRPVFAQLAQLLSHIQHKHSDPSLSELSMGMSGDFTVAVEEGTTMVRIGRRLMETVR